MNPGNKEKLECKKINSMILFLKIKRIAEIQYISREVCLDDLKLYDYMSNSKFSVDQIKSVAIESGWKENE